MIRTQTSWRVIKMSLSTYAYSWPRKIVLALILCDRFPDLLSSWTKHLRDVCWCKVWKCSVATAFPIFFSRTPTNSPIYSQHSQATMRGPERTAIPRTVRGKNQGSGSDLHKEKVLNCLNDGYIIHWSTSRKLVTGRSWVKSYERIKVWHMWITSTLRQVWRCEWKPENPVGVRKRALERRVT